MIKHGLLQKKNYVKLVWKKKKSKLNQLNYDPTWLDLKLPTTEETHSSAMRTSPLIKNIFNHSIYWLLLG